MIDLSDMSAIVTGGGSGIGSGICEILASQGAIVTVVDIDGHDADAVALRVSQTGAAATSFVADVTDRSSMQFLVDDVIGRLHKVDILVNNAGVVGASGWWHRKESNREDWDAVMEVNLHGAINVSEVVVPLMKDRSYGKILNIASIAARQGRPDMPAYCASKAAIVSWTQSLALQLAPYDVNVNAICPGMLWTPLYEKLTQYRSQFDLVPGLDYLDGEEHFQAEVETRIPLKRPQTPNDVGRLVAFLASDDARNITGQAINLDGGARMN